ncbi:helix-turn-helix domain-containing protein [Streptomyces sp. NPDC052051]|uniref:helix-turn-helix domain-containing protein n=1 Tax=Streptomyces sp. NPDC052051 TaxID=3154649 RepID=UPI003435519A
MRRWRGRFTQPGLPGLRDRELCGRPASFTPMQAAETKALACQLPAESCVPLSHWSCPELAREAVARGIAPFLSASAVRRWSAQDALAAKDVRPLLEARGLSPPPQPVSGRRTTSSCCVTLR